MFLVCEGDCADGMSESYRSDQSAGTSLMLDDASRPPLGQDSCLKYDRSGPVPVLLVPQPSDDPDDPLVGIAEEHV